MIYISIDVSIAMSIISNIVKNDENIDPASQLNNNCVSATIK
jgi:hypothetical protein